jgi:hypothetical protein
MDEAKLAELFLKYDYAETKDLAKSFLTLAAGILVVSVAFGEKVVNFEKALIGEKVLLLLCWASIVASIILGGLAVVYIGIAAGAAVYGSIDYENANLAWLLMLVAGTIFVLGLIFLVLSAASAMFLRPKSERNGAITHAMSDACTSDTPETMQTDVTTRRNLE